ncbi:maleylpyruvate isomerase family mycothiol-dependent enzyme [Actinoplanes sp. NPDC023936]|uniref:maleylpyruvate isomerase family mycothiol-dependent enzyme n=1 Tax=Actinoplanes sp. NPDC023936 TaxID=3154910 RepID=UPI0033E7E5AA
MTGTDSHETVLPLIGAWALDACSTAEAEVVEAHLVSCPACAAEAGELREVAAGLAGDDLRQSPGSTARLLSSARRVRRPAAAAPAFAAPYAAQVAALDLLLSGLDAERWRRTAAYEEMTVHDLVAHLAATDSLIAAGLGLPVEPPVEPGQRLAARTAAVLRRERGRPAEETRRSWRAQADAVCRALREHPAPATVTMGRPFPVTDALLARAFETWIHREDIAAAVGRPTVPPLPEHLHPMTDLAVRSLPGVLTRRLTAHHDQLVRLDLTGDGGGTWTVPLSLPDTVPVVARPAATVTVDVVEFCRLAGARRDPDRIGAEVAGDVTLAREFLAAVPAMAPVP